MEDTSKLLAAIILGIYGLLAGSFVTAFTWRFKHKKNWVSDRSRCDSCGHILKPRDLIPLLSWILNKRVCRFCKKSVSWQYPAIELATAVLFSTSFIFWPFKLTGSLYILFGLWLLLLILFMILIVYDFRYMLLPNKIVQVTTVVALLYVVATFVLDGTADAQSLFWWQSLASAGLLSGLFWLMYQISKGTWIGGGDVKLAVSLGLVVLKPEYAFMLLMFASLLGTAFGLAAMSVRKKTLKARIPFGPMLMIACVIVVLFGARILEWYTV